MPIETSISLFALIGFLFAAYSVIANDSVQTLGTFIASNSKIKWYYLWLAASFVLVLTISYSWWTYGGDISYGRLNKIPFEEVQWYHALAPALLVGLTRIGIPVSTSLLVLSVFASTLVFEKILVKSFMGYAVAAVFAYSLWGIVCKFFQKTDPKTPEKNVKFWRTFQWLSTGFLWYTWLSHDVANIAVFLPRSLNVAELLFVLTTFIIGLAYIFWTKGGKIQNVVISKTNVSYIKSATLIDLTYAFILLYFKQYNDLPMSTTWVFVGLLCGREMAIATFTPGYKFKDVFPIVGKDIMKIFFGLALSVALVIIIQRFLA